MRTVYRFTFPLRWNVASSIKIKRGTKESSSMCWSIRSQHSTRFLLSFGRRTCTSYRRYGLNSKRSLYTRQTVGRGIPSSLFALRFDLRGLRSKLSWIRLTFSSDTRGRPEFCLYTDSIFAQIGDSNDKCSSSLEIECWNEDETNAAQQSPTQF